MNPPRRQTCPRRNAAQTFVAGADSKPEGTRPESLPILTPRHVWPEVIHLRLIVARVITAEEARPASMVCAVLGIAPEREACQARNCRVGRYLDFGVTWRLAAKSLLRIAYGEPCSTRLQRALGPYVSRKQGARLARTLLRSLSPAARQRVQDRG